KARQQAGGRQSRQEPPGEAGDRGIALGKAPDWRALEDDELLDERGDRGDYLDGRGTGADDGDTPGAQVLVVGPARRVQHEAGVVGEPWDLRQLWLGQNSSRADHESRSELLAAVNREAPEVIGGIEAGIEYFGIQPDPRAQVVGIDAALSVGLQLAAR